MPMCELLADFFEIEGACVAIVRVCPAWETLLAKSAEGQS
jgi:hypothetical protein